MSTYAIGDIQGCYDEFQALLSKINFSPANDQLWLVGDLVNRGPKSLETLEYLHDIQDSVKIVLGNHDLHLLAIAHGHAEHKKSDTLKPLLKNRNSHLLKWLQQQPLMHTDASLGYSMLHAGIVPQWTVNDALSYSSEVSSALRNPKANEFFRHMYGNKPNQWEPELAGADRLRFITNTFTRLRYCTKKGKLDLQAKGRHAGKKSLQPWFEFRQKQDQKNHIVFGHWSTLGLNTSHGTTCIDTGCVWGQALTALRLENLETYAVASQQANPFK